MESSDLKLSPISTTVQVSSPRDTVVAVMMLGSLIVSIVGFTEARTHSLHPGNSMDIGAAGIVGFILTMIVAAYLWPSKRKVVSFDGEAITERDAQTGAERIIRVDAMKSCASFVRMQYILWKRELTAYIRITADGYDKEIRYTELPRKAAREEFHLFAAMVQAAVNEHNQSNARFAALYGQRGAALSDANGSPGAAGSATIHASGARSATQAIDTSARMGEKIAMGMRGVMMLSFAIFSTVVLLLALIVLGFHSTYLGGMGVWSLCAIYFWWDYLNIRREKIRRKNA